jgi:heme oxygenase
VHTSGVTALSTAQRLRDGTWPLHRRAEAAGIMPDLLRGRLPRPAFCRLQRNLHALYQALESGIAQHAAGQPALQPLADARLRRAPALAADLLQLQGSRWPELPLVPALQAYVQRLQQLDGQAPLQLAAHAYVRYLGDLAGGQMMLKPVRQVCGLPPGAVPAFFDFGDAQAVAALRSQLRQALDGLPLDAAGVQALVDEACWGFGQHIALFEQLQL